MKNSEGFTVWNTWTNLQFLQIYKRKGCFFSFKKSVFFTKKLLASAVEPKFKIRRTLEEPQDAQFFFKAI